MDLPTADEKLLKALAVALVDLPRGTFKDIAVAAGVSKATLNRFCGTRDNLIEMLLNHSSVVMNQIIADANLESAPPREALRELIEGHLTHRELLAFLVFQWRPDSLDLDAGGSRWLPYSDALDAFFLRGQKEGAFRIDIAAPALAELFASVLSGLVDAERRGRVARSGLAALAAQFFLEGAGRA
ncbi:TetR/AcrR family transcriptional regulator [Pseudomonas kuykendallii]|uniref:TetR/AcrR family transcriptional regulator, mexCD-oprJ operon repressor n=1 Tax=Pseudomonas kuykendallii TaxID=1007099 RepID=A0A1H2Z9A9_9PSED|nr:TetR/AcrR family transcriptional regulator [Pseudomonas kuykendallii]MCQ4271554.1 TetR/AcrR family transcriptional regulator [Pseudomonas kuykendallii]SDX13931.1 TetR/AcrR family transcriptional regulator, mexCD-oprJ operon repressor [Pseudomonas kuykendallii]